MKENKKVEQQAEDILRAYADELDAQYADAFDAILAEDPDYQKNIERYGKRRYVKPQKRILRYAAILLVAIFAASVIVPVPQASAWRIWWLDLIAGQSDVDMQVDAENEYDFVDCYPGKLPKGFELSDEEYDANVTYSMIYHNKEGKYICFKQQKKDKMTSYVDSEKSSTEAEAIGSFQVLVTYSKDDVIFEFSTEHAVGRVHTNAGYEIGKEFILKLKKY